MEQSTLTLFVYFSKTLSTVYILTIFANMAGFFFNFQMPTFSKISIHRLGVLNSFLVFHLEVFSI